jgi:hypothetical protein
MDAPSRPGGHRTVVGVQQPPSPHARDTHSEFNGAPRTVQPVHERAGEQAAVTPWLLGGTGCSSGLPAGGVLLAPPSWLLVRLARVAGGEDLAAAAGWVLAGNRARSLWRRIRRWLQEQEGTVAGATRGGGGAGEAGRRKSRVGREGKGIVEVTGGKP